jgi:hypothetical protein
MELTDELKELFTRPAKALSGSARRIFMADVVEKIGRIPTLVRFWREC